MPNHHIAFKDLGLMDYHQAWSFQEEIFDQIIQVKTANRSLGPYDQLPTPNYLLFCEHNPVYTLGKSGKPEHLLLSQEDLAAKRIAWYPINRGGDITYHGPGQITGYPVLDLENFMTDIHKYLRFIEEAIIQVCAIYGIKAGRIEGLTGVWIEERKICALGVRAARWVTMHGFAFNVNTELHYFDYIVPCGIDDKEVTSLAKEVGHPLDMSVVKNQVKEALASQFGWQYLPFA